MGAALTKFVVTNPNGMDANNTVTADPIAAWRKNVASRLFTNEFSKELRVSHELFAPEVFDEQCERVQSLLAGLITGNHVNAPD